MAITIDDVEALRRQLAELPRNRPREVTKQEAVTLLASELAAAKRRGYSPDDLAGLLSEKGIAINAETLRGYLRRARRSHKRRVTKVAPLEKASEASQKEQPRSAAAAPPPVLPPPTGIRPAPSPVGSQTEALTSARPSAAPPAVKDASGTKGTGTTGR
jgi:hypothetical protein